MLLFAALTACEQERPRTYYDFMEDGFAREGVLVRCNQDREATAIDVECANARRAAAAIAAQGDKERAGQLERESERKIVAMRDRDELRQQAVTEAQAVAEAERQAAYDAQWRDGAPAPAASEEDYDPFAVRVPERLPLQIAAVAPPKPELQITAPELEIKTVAIPRPFRAEE